MKSFSKVGIMILIALFSILLLSACNNSEEYTEGLLFTQVSGGYSVSRGDATDNHIIIPSLYNGQEVIAIADKGFRQSNIKSIYIPSTVISIGNMSFYNCSSLTIITIPDSVTNIGNKAFAGDLLAEMKLATVTFGDNSQLTSIGSGAFSYCTSLVSITIPNSVTSLGCEAFYACTSLTTITFGDNSQLTSIGSLAFGNCSSLTEMIIPEGVTSIDSSTLFNCSSLENITIPDKVTSIGDNAFFGCSSLESITIPDSVTSIGGWAFDNCSSLTSVTVESATPPSLGNDAFYSTHSTLKIYVPSESVETYKSASDWSNWSSRIYAKP